MLWPLSSEKNTFRYFIPCSQFPNFPYLTWPFLRICFKTDTFLGITEPPLFRPLTVSLSYRPCTFMLFPRSSDPRPTLCPWPYPLSLHLTFLENPTPGPFKVCLPCAQFWDAGSCRVDFPQLSSWVQFYINLQPQLAPSPHLHHLSAFVLDLPAVSADLPIRLNITTQIAPTPADNLSLLPREKRGQQTSVFSKSCFRTTNLTSWVLTLPPSLPVHEKSGPRPYRAHPSTCAANSLPSHSQGPCLVNFTLSPSSQNQNMFNSLPP